MKDSTLREQNLRTNDSRHGYVTNSVSSTVPKGNVTQRKNIPSSPGMSAFQIAQLKRNEEGKDIQLKADPIMQFHALKDKEQANNPVQTKSNKTGLPENLKSGIENLSGYSMDDVKVHYNSDKPANLNAHAYAQGSDIHIAPGQENHLPHEAWHTVQQKQGRVQPTLQMKGKINVNDDNSLEQEADLMGAKALSSGAADNSIQLKNVSSSANVTQAKMRANNFSELITEQNELQQQIKSSPEEFKEGYTTVGFEHEFAQMETGPLRGISHLEIAKSEEKMPLTKLPFMLETDAQNALELVTPPFLIETIKGKPIPEPDEIEKVDNMIKKTLTDHTAKNPNINAIVADFAEDPGLTFPLKKVEIERKNITPNTQEGIYNKGIGRNNAKVSRETLGNISLIPSKKGAQEEEESHISTHVNFATDADTYDKIQDINSVKPQVSDKSAKGYIEVQTGMKEKMFESFFQSDELGGKEDIARKNLILKLEGIRDAVFGKLDNLGKIITKDISENSESSYSKSLTRIIKSSPLFQKKKSFGESHATIISKLNTVTLTQEAIQSCIDSYAKKLNEFQELISNAYGGTLDDCATKRMTADPKLFEFGPQIAEAKELGKEIITVTGNSNPNLKIFINSLARTLSGLYAVPASEKVRIAQEQRLKDPTKPMDIGLATTMSSRVKDINQVWIKDTIMNIGLGILSHKDWQKVLDTTADPGFVASLQTIDTPTFSKQDPLSKAEFNSLLVQALNTLRKNIIDDKLNQSIVKGKRNDISKIFLNPKAQPDLFTHKAKHIGARQDTFIPGSKVQMPKIWKDKRLHVVESRKDSVQVLRELKRLHEQSTTPEESGVKKPDLSLSPMDDSRHGKMDDLDLSTSGSSHRTFDVDSLYDFDEETEFDQRGNAAIYADVSKEFLKNHADMIGTHGGVDGVVHSGNSDSASGSGVKKDWSKLRSDMRENTDRLGEWWATQGISVAHNGGRGCNCLIISLLQHATGNYDSEHHADAKKYRDLLKSQYREIREGEMLYSDNPAYMWLVGKINKDFGVSMNVTFVVSDARGLPVIAPEIRTGDNHVMIWDKGGHFEALYKSRD